MKTRILILVIGLGLTLVGRPLLADGPDADAVKKELAKFQGTWRVVAVEENGAALPDDKLREANGTVTIEGDKHTLKYNGQLVGTVTITIDPTAKPRRYDMTIPEGPEKGKVQLGIYELDGETWKLCLNKTGGDRPTEFSGKADSGWVLVVMKKVKPTVEKK